MFTQDCGTGPVFSFPISLFPLSFFLCLIIVPLFPRPMFTPDRGSFLYFSNQIHRKTQGMVRNRKNENFMSCLIVLYLVMSNSYESSLIFHYNKFLSIKFQELAFNFPFPHWYDALQWADHLHLKILSLECTAFHKKFLMSLWFFICCHYIAKFLTFAFQYSK